MKIKFLCSECASEEGGGTFNYIETEISETNAYTLTCDKGHTYNYLLGLEKFELLYELGALALIDGYTREAVSSFATSVERLYEYCIQMLLIKNSITKADI
ncbi:hypothetical protein P9D57_01435 [Bacillus sonorensis]|uniref:hypothetical protein n=1 Tax=Bacillus sonorensis TaxID=119858 RepID=UPI002DB91F7F|nr:hypothetical protein [Bacillus sonorensis]MEC1437433.1 hypothetical protein [Bacillus sonorensis]